MEEEEILEIDRVVFKNGTTVSIKDAKARTAIEKLANQMKPLHTVHISTEPIDPSEEFGGQWELLDTHLLAGLYLYERVDEVANDNQSDEEQTEEGA